MFNLKALFFFILFIFLVGSIIGIWHFIKRWRGRKAFRQKLPDIISKVRSAKGAFDKLTGFERYFANRDEQDFLNTYQGTRAVIVPDFADMGLAVATIGELQLFCENFDLCGSKRKDYNNEFVCREQEQYASFFAGLEEYPLSADQTEAIIRDEDNNLVLAGAGTGKTTTISGKVAYLLQKQMAAPDELLII